MADFKQCEFFLLRYVPDVVKGEFVNLGVVLLEEGDDGFTGVRFPRDWRRVRGLDPEAISSCWNRTEAICDNLLQSRFAGGHQLSRGDVAARVAAGADAANRSPVRWKLRP